MKYPAYAIRDKVKGFDAQILLQDNDQAAYRGFGYLINNPQGIQNYSPADFDLYRIGEFDTESGKFKAIMPDFIVNGASVYNEK